MRRLREEQSGFTLVELVLAMGLMLAVMSTTLGTLERFDVNVRVNQDQNEAQDRARTALDRMARELRNVGSDVGDSYPFLRTAGQDVVFETVNSDGTHRWVRYCLNTTEQKLYGESSPTNSSFSTTCPDTGAPSSKVVAENVVNGTNRDVFFYPSYKGTLDSRSVWARLYVDIDPNRKPGAQTLETRVLIRNQDWLPKAAFFATPIGDQVRLDGSPSSDPEGEVLTFSWYDNNSFIGEGIVFDYKASRSGSRPIMLCVADPAGLRKCITSTIHFN